MPKAVQQRYVALLYSISLPAGRRLVMQDLKQMTLSIGLEAPHTLLSTGNLLFTTQQTEINNLEARLETAYAATFGRHVDFLVRDTLAWKNIVATNPFVDAAEQNASNVMVRVMRNPLSKEKVADIASAARDGERLATVSGNLWISFAEAPSRSKLLPLLTRQKLGVGTIRNWNTARAIDSVLRS
ncbi:DUF1697 domain-containing protein [Devosia algicola]|uniref:DUF1697 domain-containing protein n=1 Tax=Devosia algicola TaxID=3026418 RepID=A0ABY7YJK3_9HYPH|nr:DUF1697 domain-containing protein [Devosia algicola]WDR01155.1 DUF1697 domain-containing protein [Devosia algicola]